MELNEYLLKIKNSKQATNIDLKVIIAAMDRDVSLQEFEKIMEVANERANSLETTNS